ncbi:MAG: hypothetical protein DWI70_05155, partial [Chloroflexi bacterium]
MEKPGRTPVTFTPMRAAISRRMVESKSKAPHFYVSTDIEMEAVTAANNALNEGKSGD